MAEFLPGIGYGPVTSSREIETDFNDPYPVKKGNLNLLLFTRPDLDGRLLGETVLNLFRTPSVVVFVSVSVLYLSVSPVKLKLMDLSRYGLRSGSRTLNVEFLLILPKSPGSRRETREQEKELVSCICNKTYPRVKQIINFLSRGPFINLTLRIVT